MKCGSPYRVEEYIAPHFKGVVNWKDPKALALVTRDNPDSHDKIPLDRYVELVRETKGKCPALTQDVTRASAAVLWGLKCKDEGIRPRLITVEGCWHHVGHKKMTGANMMEELWREMVPRELIDPILYPMTVRMESRCTVEEARWILEAIEESRTRIQAITHSYHQARVEQTLGEEAGLKHEILPVLTPEQIAERVSVTDPQAQFLVDVIRAGELPEKILRREERGERWINTPLHRISRFGEKATGGLFCLESFLARKLRKG